MSAYESYYNLQKSVQKTGANLDTFSTTLKDVEKCLSTTQNGGEVENACVLDVLDSMSTVKSEYDNLRQDLQEVQQLQREMSSTLQYQLQSMTQTYNILKKRIEAKISLPMPLPQQPLALRRPQTAPPMISSETLSSISSLPPSN